MTDEKCTLCGKIAVKPPFCLACLLEMSDEDYRIQLAVFRLKQALELGEDEEDEMVQRP